jgi:adenylate cyclase
MNASTAGPSRARRSLWQRLLDISFRTKLLIALVGTVGFLGLASLAVVRTQTNRQVDWMIERSGERAQRALTELERFRRANLERVAQRLTGSIRIVAALDAALDGGDLAAFTEDVRYELTLAELDRGLVEFTDDRGRPVLTLIDGMVVAHRQPDARVAEGLNSGVAPGYRVLDGVVFAVQGHRLELFGEPVGVVTLGFPIDVEVVSRLGAIVGADVCLAVDGQCLVGTPATTDAELERRLIAAARSAVPTFTSVGGERVALVSSPLPAATAITAVLAVPLEDVLTPFDRIRTVERAAAAVALLLAVALAMVLSTGLTTPIRMLVTATERVRRGDYDFRIDVPQRDEIGTLADAFNGMTQGLLLKEKYRGVLDKVVSPGVAEELMKGELRLGGETREITILFADIRNFTTHTERMLPEQVITMLNEWLELAAAAIEEEGGVIDKYVGDQVMAIFGAPVAQADHEAHAVRAGLRLRELTDMLGRRREAEGKAPLAIGIGINSGPAVAGNMGSARRLNYTVLGASVNAAARLCSEAPPGALLVSERTYAAVRNLVVATPLPPRIFKGFTAPVTPYSIRALAAVNPGAPLRSAVQVLVLTLSCLVPRVAHAQAVDVPTLEELGVRFASAGGLVQIQPSLRIEVGGLWPADEPAWHIGATDPLFNGTARAFVDLFVGRRLYGLTELRVDRGQPPQAGEADLWLQQAFLRVTPLPGADVHVQAGKFVSPFGNYPQRAHTRADAFIRPPLLYDHRTVMSADTVPLVSDGVFTWKDNPQFRAAGLPIVWDVPYPIGVTVGAGGARWRAVGGLVNTAPSAEPEAWSGLDFRAAAGPSLVGRVSALLLPELEVGTSYSHGSYMNPVVADASGPLRIDRQNQSTYGIETTFTRGYFEFHSEVMFNQWEVYRRTDPLQDVAYYLEARQTLLPGVFAAARYGAIHFRLARRSDGTPDRWDYDKRRWQIAGGYRLGRNSEIRAEYMVNRTLQTVDPADDLLSLQWWLTL